MSETYEARCNEAAEAQGLTPYMAMLDNMGRKWELWQSGGFTMVLAIPYDVLAAGSSVGASHLPYDAIGRYITITDEIGCLTLVNNNEEWLCPVCDLAEAGECRHALDTPEVASVAWLESLFDMASAQ